MEERDSGGKTETMTTELRCFRYLGSFKGWTSVSCAPGRGRQMGMKNNVHTRRSGLQLLYLSQVYGMR
jgi:hypothetical protein